MNKLLTRDEQILADKLRAAHIDVVRKVLAWSGPMPKNLVQAMILAEKSFDKLHPKEN